HFPVSSAFAPLTNKPRTSGGDGCLLHRVIHTGTRFYCFYCNNVSFSEAELNAHLKQHTAKYPFKCPHCGQGYMRRLCLVKHIERLHSKSISQGPAKPGMTKLSHVPVNSALPSVPTADLSSLRPVVRVTVPTPSAPAVRLSKDEQRGKTLDTNVSHAPNGNTERLSPLNGLIQHNRALTVSLPEEITIPAGCLVELVEVKTVNGTKELKLRLVSQQENESVIKDSRTAVSQNTALGKPLSPTLNHPNTVKSVSMGMSNRTLNEPSSVKTPVLSNPSNSKISAWTREARSNERAGEGDMPEPEGFPVISSVFSLSQQPEEGQGSIQPLVMALRGIVMNKSNSSASAPQDHIKITNGTEQVKEVLPSRYCAQMAKQDGSFTCDPLLTERTSDSVKVEERNKGIQHSSALINNHIQVKEEKNRAMSMDNIECSQTPASESSADQGSVSKIATHIDTSVAADPLQQMAKSEHDISSKFLTVSLKRVQVGVWKKNKKGLKLRISKYKTHLPVGSVTDCTVIYPMPLKVDQLVKRPGPYQPVVVLNHPKPRAPVQGARADTVADTGASEVVPKCQILKMRLSKVMGQKYEVMGCTVRVCP
uniref:C2H2-type domain-containing protein n=1 Tax=Lates calcarifer TaxID=8187 RepID=A0A4W6FI64_LATCA